MPTVNSGFNDMKSNNYDNSLACVVADVGGTNTRIALIKDSKIQSHTVKHYANDNFSSFDQLLESYLRVQKIDRCAAACIAIASAINGDSATLTNRDWLIDKNAIKRIAKCDSVILINDFEALALSLNHIPESDTIRLFEGAVTSIDKSQAKKIVLGAGTGFNAAQLSNTAHSTDTQPIPSQHNYFVSCAECGHITLPIENAQELKLRDALALKYTRASIERVLSGRGLLELYQWLCSEHNQTAKYNDAVKIALSACNQDDLMTRQAGKIFCRFFARVAGDLALAYLPYGGVYLSGGVTRGLAPLLQSSEFIQNFTAKGRQTELMKSFNLYLITSDNTALIGCLAALTYAQKTH